MERVVLTLGNVEVDTARDPQRFWYCGKPAARGRRYPYSAAPPRPVPQLQPQPQLVPRFALPSATKPEPATGFPPSEAFPSQQPQQQ